MVAVKQVKAKSATIKVKKVRPILSHLYKQICTSLTPYPRWENMLGQGKEYQVEYQCFSITNITWC